MKIYFLNGELSGVKVELEKSSSIGRDESNTLVITGLGISRHHATFAFENNTWKLIDGGSTNGSRVNQQRVNGEQELKPGDIVDLGNQSIRFGDLPTTATPDNSPKDSIQATPVLKTNAAPALKPEVTTQQSALKAKNNKIIFKPHKVEKSTTSTVSQASTAIIEPPPKETNKSVPVKNVKAKLATSKAKKKGNLPSSKATGTVESKELSDALKNGKISLFKPVNEQADKTADDPSASPKRRFSNLLFYVVVIFVAFLAIVIFIKLNENNNKPLTTARQITKRPKLFLLIYEKTKLSPDNIFRFFMKVENRKAYFAIDDLKSQRSYEKTVEITQNQLDDLKYEIEQTEIMNESSPPPGSAKNELDETKHLIISYNGLLKDIKITNNTAPIAFTAVTDAINDFAKYYGLQTISMTPEELKDKAKELFNKAELLFHNRASNPANLRKAVKRYKMAEDFLAQFSPKPPMWSKAKKQAGIAEAMRRKRLTQLKNDELKYKKLAEYEKRDEVLTEMMQLCLPESKVYLKIRKKKITNDEKIRSLNRR